MADSANAIASENRSMHLRDGIGAPAHPHDWTARAAPRHEMVDVVRFFAAAGVVFVHSIESKELDRWSFLGRFAVSFYIFAAVYLQARAFKRDPDRSLLAYSGLRLQRLCLPFAAWSLIYLAARNVKRIAVLDRSPVRLSPSLLLSGGDYHLWFLPFLLIASILTACLFKATVLRGARWRWPLIVATVTSGIAFCFLNVPAALTSNFENNDLYAFWQWWYTIPSLLLAIAFAVFMTMGKKSYRVPGGLAWCGLTLALAGISYQVWRGRWVQFPRAMSGLGCVMVALAPWYGPVLLQIARFGRYGYGIYLSHVVAVEIIHMMIHRAHLNASPYLDLMTFAISFVTAIAIAKALGRNEKLAWLNG